MDEGALAKITHSLLGIVADENTKHIELFPTGNIRVHSQEGIETLSDWVPLEHYAGIISRMESLADLDPREREVPQEGIIRTPLNGEIRHFKVYTSPAFREEGKYLRLEKRTWVRDPYS